MTWFKVDDGLAFHRKTLRAGNASMGVWVRAGSEASAQLSDGFVSTLLARQIGSAAEVRRLVDAGLWHRHDAIDGCGPCVEHGMLAVAERAGEPGYVFHEWWVRNPRRLDVEDKREKRATAGRVGGVKSGQIRRERSKPEATPEANASPVASTMREPPARPGPTQTPLLTLAGRLSSGDAHGTPPPAEQIGLWQDLAGPGVDLEAEARAYLERNLDRPARDERGAWLGWLRAARRRHDATVPAPRPACHDPACHGGWLTTDPDRPVACRTCRPHLRPAREEAS